ncbi:competence protein ComFB [Vibrio sp. V27_P1S3P104]|uniref:late competence development ComFB family protein n=1 Tax=unclassified Vibrio TaxID=2614977 RepID=UPI0013728162|nr:MULTISPECIES: late competence development ComFB family protein [unclassified Vibrio]NAW70362.1 competence protein ComFB [Vibrio sp. V28_P6S34P95]NAX04740.1 competence protein ComFB [Vibrio sp. V30_P3S12P165]NAX37798.1 competence protein ComFB [Vibrio sp. V27_P1S3P104]NAX40830.1 competence protein ComFB [Vibrio sp. V26_P1S5P106]NNN43767.1 competence protein ComFB [Vibrio sp. 1-1(7)]
MQLNMEVHNYMETLVGQVLAQSYYVSQYDTDQLADLACLALNQIRPVYIRFDIDFLSSLPEERLVILKQRAVAAVEAAEPMIINDRRTDRELIIPVLFGTRTVDDEMPLEWYETPIMGEKLIDKE